jgi:hypothetical protein
MLGFKGPAQPSPSLGDALNAGYLYLEVRCLGCDTHQTVALNIVRRPKATPIHELECYMRCKDCSQVRGYPYKRSHLVALRPTRISALIRRLHGGRASADNVQTLFDHHEPRAPRRERFVNGHREFDPQRWWRPFISDAALTARLASLSQVAFS